MNTFTHAGGKTPAFEPTLDEALADPIVGLILQRDGLTIEQVRNTLERERDRLLLRRHQVPRPHFLKSVTPGNRA